MSGNLLNNRGLPTIPGPIMGSEGELKYLQTVTRSFTLNSSLNGSDPSDTIDISSYESTIAVPASVWGGGNFHGVSGGNFAISAFPVSNSSLSWDVGALSGQDGWSDRSLSVNVHLIEIPNVKSIQHIAGVSTDGTTKTINEVNTAKSFCMSVTIWGNAKLYNRGLTPEITDSTTVTFTRESSSGSYPIESEIYNAARWAVIELK